MMLKYRDETLPRWVLKKIVRWIVDTVLAIYTYFVAPDQKNQLPQVNNPLLLQPAVTLAAKIKRGQVKSRDVVKAYLKRIEEVNPAINAVVEIYQDALKEADEVDMKVAFALKENQVDAFKDKPLLGIPFSFKNSVRVVGMTISHGLVSRRGLKADQEAKIVRNLREAGAIPLALTNVPELLMFYDCYNKIDGKTNNPYDLSRVPGGSSGGEGALIGAAGSLFGIGTDMAGSIRMPSAFCGIYGHKPTHGIVPSDGLDSDECELTTAGPMCRYFDDLLPTFKVMAGDNINKLPNIDSSVKLADLKFYYMLGDKDPLKTPLKRGPRDALLKTVSLLTSVGLNVEEVDFPEFDASYNLWMRRYVELYPFRHTLTLTDGEEDISLTKEIGKEILKKSPFTRQQLLVAVDVDIALSKWFKDTSNNNKNGNINTKCLTKKLNAVGARVKELLGDNGVLLYPSHPEPAPKHEETLLKLRNIGYTAMFNALNMPATQCPIELHNGLPVGVQVVANTNNDHLTLAVAKELDKAFGGWKAP